MLNFFQIPIALFYIFLSFIYFFKIENKLLKLIVFIFGISGVCYFTKIVYPNDPSKYIVFIGGLLASILFLIYSIKKGNRILLVLFIVPFILGYLVKGLYLPFFPIISFLKIFSSGVWVYLSIVNHKRGDKDMEQEINVMNLFAIELILGLIGMLNFIYKTWL
jgi:hypothetical protein